MRVDLQRLFWHSGTAYVSPLEDFSTDALAIAIEHDAEPLLQALRGVSEWKESSGVPSIDFSEVAHVTADTQQYVSADGLLGGRLDLVVKLVTNEGAVERYGSK
jgi:hypothetical protein